MFAQQETDASSLIAESPNRLAHLPVLVLNVHSRCNCRCVMCDIWKREENLELKTADLQRHRESFRRLGVRWVVLSGGEPLLHSDLIALCRFFRELGIRLTLLSTGLLLSKRASEVAEWFDDIIVSLDGPAPVHDAIRNINGAYRLIQSGVAAVRSFRPEIRITARTTVQKRNHRRLRETVDAARTIDLSGISFLAADLTSQAFNRELLWPVERQSAIGLSAAEISGLEEEVENLISSNATAIQSGYIAESAAKLRRIVNHFKAYLGQGVHHSPVCNAPWVSAVIETDGSVRPCFFHRAIGNIHQADFGSIVNGEDALSFRRSLDVEKNPICRQCVCSLNLKSDE